MQPYLGRRLSSDDIIAANAWLAWTDDQRDQLRAQARAVRAYEVPVLHGLTLTARDQGAVASALAEALHAQFPGIGWMVPADVVRVTEKYQFLNIALAAPPDETTGAAMALELYGPVVQIDDTALRGEAYTAWRQAHMDAGLHHSPLQGRLTIELHVATYANILYPGIGVPFYS